MLERPGSIVSRSRSGISAEGGAALRQQLLGSPLNGWRSALWPADDRVKARSAVQRITGSVGRPPDVRTRHEAAANNLDAGTFVSCARRAPVPPSIRGRNTGPIPEPLNAFWLLRIVRCSAGEFNVTV
ncbi:hypothetical protein JCM18382A_46700 [Bradyrhizobium sp. 17-4]